MVLNSFSHVFESDAVVKPLCPLANLFGGCFCLGSGPFCVSGLLFLLTKRKSGWGICGSSGWSLCCLVCCDLPEFPDPFGPCTNWRFTAFAHVRTEPQCDIGHTRGKKKHQGGLVILLGPEWTRISIIKSYTTGQGVGLKSGKRRRVPWLDVL